MICRSLENSIREEKLMKRSILLAALAAAFVLAVLSPYAFAAMGGGGEFNKTAVVESGVKTMVAGPHASQMQGAPVPYTVKTVTNPKHGTVSMLRVGDRTKVFYQSRKGYVGEDSFQFVRIANDAFAGTYTVAVTVK